MTPRAALAKRAANIGERGVKRRARVVRSLGLLPNRTAPDPRKSAIRATISPGAGSGSSPNNCTTRESASARDRIVEQQFILDRRDRKVDQRKAWRGGLGRIDPAEQQQRAAPGH